MDQVIIYMFYIKYLVIYNQYVLYNSIIMDDKFLPLSLNIVKHIFHVHSHILMNYIVFIYLKRDHKKQKYKIKQVKLFSY
jgi:hypothetical protein